MALLSRFCASVWVDPLRRGDAGLVEPLDRPAVVMHPFVVGEIACGSVRDGHLVPELMQDLPPAVVASPDEVLGFTEIHVLHGRRIGYVDAHLLASVALTPGASLWTRDARLRRMAASLNFAHAEPAH